MYVGDEESDLFNVQAREREKTIEMHGQSPSHSAEHTTVYCDLPQLSCQTQVQVVVVFQ